MEYSSPQNMKARWSDFYCSIRIHQGGLTFGEVYYITGFCKGDIQILTEERTSVRNELPKRISIEVKFHWTYVGFITLYLFYVTCLLVLYTPDGVYQHNWSFSEDNKSRVNTVDSLLSYKEFFWKQKRTFKHKFCE